MTSAPKIKRIKLVDKIKVTGKASWVKWYFSKPGNEFLVPIERQFMMEHIPMFKDEFPVSYEKIVAILLGPAPKEEEGEISKDLMQ